MGSLSLDMEMSPGMGQEGIPEAFNKAILDKLAAIWDELPHVEALHTRIRDKFDVVGTAYTLDWYYGIKSEEQLTNRTALLDYDYASITARIEKEYRRRNQPTQHAYANNANNANGDAQSVTATASGQSIYAFGNDSWADFAMVNLPGSSDNKTVGIATSRQDTLVELDESASVKYGFIAIDIDYRDVTASTPKKRDAQNGGHILDEHSDNLGFPCLAPTPVREQHSAQENKSDVTTIDDLEEFLNPAPQKLLVDDGDFLKPAPKKVVVDDEDFLESTGWAANEHQYNDLDGADLSDDTFVGDMVNNGPLSADDDPFVDHPSLGSQDLTEKHSNFYRPAEDPFFAQYAPGAKLVGDGGIFESCEALEATRSLWLRYHHIPLPATLKTGVIYYPKPNRVSKEHGHRRTVLITNLPEGIELRDMLAKVRVGRVVRAMVTKTPLYAGRDTATALVVFTAPEHARALIRYAAAKPISFEEPDTHGVFRTAAVQLADSPTYPFNRMVNKAIIEGKTRVLVLERFRPVLVQGLATLMGLTRRFRRWSMLEEVWYDGRGDLHVAFSSIQDAINTHVLIKGRGGVKNLFGWEPRVVRFGPDPCDEVQGSIDDVRSQTVPHLAGSILALMKAGDWGKVTAGVAGDAAVGGNAAGDNFDCETGLEDERKDETMVKKAKLEH